MAPMHKGLVVAEQASTARHVDDRKEPPCYCPTNGQTTDKGLGTTTTILASPARRTVMALAINDKAVRKHSAEIRTVNSVKRRGETKGRKV